MEKLKLQLAEADLAAEARKKPAEDSAGPRIVGEGLVIDEWVQILALNELLVILFIDPENCK